jgi:hypothetical protein
MELVTSKLRVISYVSVSFRQIASRFCRSSSIHSQVLRDTFGLTSCLLVAFSLVLKDSKDVETSELPHQFLLFNEASLTVDVYRL